MRKMTQDEAVIDYLQHNEWIDPAECWNKIHSMKLATIISRLKNKGYKFKDEWVKGSNCYGSYQFKKYKLDGGPNG